MNDSNAVLVNLPIDYKSNCVSELSRNESSYKGSNSPERCPIHGGDDDYEEPVVKEDEWQQ